MIVIPELPLPTSVSAHRVLKGASFEGDLHGPLLQASLEQHFHNPGQHQVELIYTFPLPWQALLLELSVDLNGQVRTATVQARAQAEANYEAARDHGDHPTLLEQNEDMSHTISLGWLAPGAVCRVTMRYAQMIEPQTEGLRLLIPTVIAPRYESGRASRAAAHRQTSPDLLAEQRFSFVLRVHDLLAQEQIASPSHALQQHWLPAPGLDEPPVLHLGLEQPAFLDRDLIITLSSPPQNRLFVSPDTLVPEGLPGQTAVVAQFMPAIAETRNTPLALQFLIDCSGSMAGDSLASAKRGLYALIERLQPGDRFSLARFGSMVEHRSRGLWPLTEATREAARRWVDTLNADMNGTEMERAVLAALAHAEGSSTDLLLVTDGQIEAIDSLIDAVRRRGSRVFVVGVGSSVAEAHLRRLAQASRGAFEAVAPNEAIEAAMVRMLRRLRCTPLESPTVQWPQGTTVLWQSPLPHQLLAGDTLVVHARLAGALSGPVSLAAASNWELTRVASADRAETVAGDALARRVAMARLPHLPTQEQVQEALRYQLVCEHTAALLVHPGQPAEGVAPSTEQVTIAPMQPAGWGGAGSVTFSTSSGAASDPDDGRRVFRAARMRPSRHDDLGYSESPRARAPQGISLATPESVALYANAAKTTWPERFDTLRTWAMPGEVVDWLELVAWPAMPRTISEAELIRAFLIAVQRVWAQNRLLVRKLSAGDLADCVAVLEQRLVPLSGKAWPEHFWRMV